MTDTSRKVIEIIANTFGIPPESISRETRFVTDIPADSLDQVEIVMDLEDHFELSIPDEDWDSDKIKTVGHVIDYIEERLS